MAHRYLVRDRAIGRVFLRMLRLPVDERAFFAEPAAQEVGEIPKRPATRRT